MSCLPRPIASIFPHTLLALPNQSSLILLIMILILILIALCHSLPLALHFPHSNSQSYAYLSATGPHSSALYAPEAFARSSTLCFRYTWNHAAFPRPRTKRRRAGHQACSDWYVCFSFLFLSFDLVPFLAPFISVQTTR